LITKEIVDLAGKASFNASDVRYVSIVVDDPEATTGTLEITTAGLSYHFVTVISGTAYDENTLSVLNGTPDLIAGSGNTLVGEPIALMTMTQGSSSEFQYEYDLGPSNTSFTFVSITNGAFVNNVFQGEYLSFPNGKIVIAAKGASGQKVKIEVRDAKQLTATFILELQPYLQNYTLVLSGANVPAGFETQRVADITIVQDTNIGSSLPFDVVTFETRGLAYAPVPLNPDLAAIRNDLVQSGLDYFRMGAGIDPVTHFPYDNMGENADNPDKFTQPTLIGFYLQILGDVVSGALDNGMTQNQALAEISLVLENLLNVQRDYGWNGLIPWLDLDPLNASEPKVALGDNANLSQSIAVMIGALEQAGLSAAQLNPIQGQANTFLANQKSGYAAFVDPIFGIFRGDVNTATGVFSAYIDRLSNEFRGAVAFLAVYFSDVIPRSVWDNLKIVVNDSYVDRNGETIRNLAPWDGGAFQIFWPMLRNDELGFSGFRRALYNQLVAQLDYAYQNRIPGILSASLIPEHGYSGAIGIPVISEANMVLGAVDIVGDVGSTYALAAAMGVDPYAVLGWLDAIDNLGRVNGGYGFFDSARSNSEISYLYLGIDVAATILGLAGNGASDFTSYLRNRGLEAAYNELYDSMSRRLGITKANSGFPNAPEFPDRSLAVFSNIASEGAINYTTPPTTELYGVQFSYSHLQQYRGHFWKLKQGYDASANQLRINYSAENSPGYIRIELKNAAGEIVYKTTVSLQEGAKFSSLVIDLPASDLLKNVTEVDLIIDPDDPNGGADADGDFIIHAIQFQHFRSAGKSPGGRSGAVTAAPLLPDPNLTSLNATVLPSNGGTTPVVSVPEVLPNVYRLEFDVTTPASSTVQIDFDPLNNGSYADFSRLTGIVFGLSSNEANSVKFEIKDSFGNKADARVSNVDVSRSYYEFLRSTAEEQGVDMTQVDTISFTVDSESVPTGDGTGSLELEIGGLQEVT